MASPRPPLRPAILDALRGYTAGAFGKDVVAGLVVATVALPLAIAFAVASGADPHAGLVTVVVAGIVVALLGGTRLGVAGPTSSFVTVLYAIVATDGFDQLLVASVLAGLILVLAGVLHLGTILKLIPYPVTTGFTAGIAFTIFLGQLPDLFGLQLGPLPPGNVERAATIFTGLGGIHGPSVAVGVATIAIIQGMKRWAPRIPGPIVALTVLTAAVALLHLPVATLGDRFPDAQGGLGAPHLPPLSWGGITAALPVAMVIAFLCAIESLSTAVVADGMAGTRHDSNQELVGQGVANVVAPLFGGLPGVGAIARTATSIQAGAQTPVASMVHALLILLVLYVAGPLAAMIPFAVLAGMLVVVAWNISQRRRVQRLFRMPAADAATMVGTLVITVVFNLAAAIIVGLLLSSAIFMRRMSDMAHVELVDPTKDVNPFGRNVHEEDIPEGVLVYSVDGPFFFGAADRFQETLATVARPPKVVVLRMKAVPYLDATGLNALEDAITGLQRRGCRVLLAGIQTQPFDMLQRAGFVHVVGDDGIHRTTMDALAHARTLLPARETS